MKVLIVAKFWDSSAGIGALRPMKIAEYLIKNGHEVAVICGKEYCDGSNTLYTKLPAFFYTGIYEKENNIYKRRNEKAISAKSGAPIKTQNSTVEKRSLFNKMKWFIYKTGYNSFKVRNSVKNSLKSIKVSTLFAPDIIFSSYAPEDVHFLSVKLKKMFSDSVWVADFRDPMANKMTHTKGEYKYRLRRQKKIFKKADVVTVVSQTWRDEFEQLGAKNAVTLYSGFDASDFDLTDSTVQNEKLTFTYTGSLYPDLSDLRPFFNALKELASNGSIDVNKIKIVYAGANSDEFDKQASILPVGIESVNHGLVSRKQSLKLLVESDVLLHALFCYPELKGIITGKLGEYWASQKPIIAIITGNTRADEFISIIEKSGTGFCYDGINHEPSYSQLKDYIIEQYRRFINNETLLYERNDQFIGQFDYAEIASRLVALKK